MDMLGNGLTVSVTALEVTTEAGHALLYRFTRYRFPDWLAVVLLMVSVFAFAPDMSEKFAPPMDSSHSESKSLESETELRWLLLASMSTV
jgi:hypothetical protein